MKYWGFLCAKLAAAGGLFAALWAGLEFLLPPPRPFYNYHFARFGQDLPWTTAILIYTLFCLGVIYLVVLDQRYRCRTCVRRLRMPVATGAWDQMLLFGPPRTEYICPYGHGTLKVSELQLTGIEGDDWQPHSDIWKELESLEGSRK